MRYGFIILSLLWMMGCLPADNRSPNGSGKPDNVVIQYWPNGNIRTEIPMTNKMKNGVAKNYYEEGTIRQEIEYKNGIKQGESIFYYENGKPYRVTNYIGNKIEGTRKLYRENGNLMAKIPYSKGIPCAGLKEYLVDGSPRQDYPKLVFMEVDEIFTKSLLTLKVSTSKKVRKIDFYYGKLKDGCFDKANSIKVKPREKGELSLFYPLPKGSFVMKEIDIVARVTTSMGNPLYLEGHYNLAAENR